MIAEDLLSLAVDGQIPDGFKAAFNSFFYSINVIDKYEDSNSRRAINEGKLKGIALVNDGKSKFFPYVSEGIIYISHRFMYYLYSYAFSLYLFTEHVMRREIEGSWNGFLDSSDEAKWACLYLDEAKKHRDSVSSWDNSLMKPESNFIAPRDVNAIFGMALCFIYLHEVSHLLLSHNPDMDTDSKILAEKDADLNALRVFFSGIVETSIKRNRAISVGILLCGSLFSVTNPKYLKSKLHPDKDVRLANILDYIEINDLEADYYLKTIVGIGINLFCRENRITIKTKVFDTAKEHYEHLLGVIGEIKE